jgi:hypothetical protein
MFRVWVGVRATDWVWVRVGVGVAARVSGLAARVQREGCGHERLGEAGLVRVRVRVRLRLRLKLRVRLRLRLRVGVRLRVAVRVGVRP